MNTSPLSSSSESTTTFDRARLLEVIRRHWGFDSLRKSLRGVYVSNTGAVGVMDGEFADDGSFVATAAGRQQGKPMAQRMIMQFDAKGAIVRGSGHTLLGTAAPIESYRGTYTKK